MALQHTIVTAYGTGGGVNTITKFHFYEDADTLAQRQALAIAVRDRLLSPLTSPCANTFAWTALVVSRYSDANDSPYVLSINITGGGSLLAPMQLAVCWNLQSGVDGRNGRGRFFVSGLQGGIYSGGLLSTTIRSTLDSNMATLQGRWCAGGSEAHHLSVFSRKNNTNRQVVTLSYNTILSTLRTRRLGTGI